MYRNSLCFSVIVLGNESFSKKKRERERELVLNKKGHSGDKKRQMGGVCGGDSGGSPVQDSGVACS